MSRINWIKQIGLAASSVLVLSAPMVGIVMGRTLTEEPAIVSADQAKSSVAAQGCTACPEAEAFEQDRKAILSMAGDFEVTFDFRETEQISDQHPSEPELTKANEKVVIVRDEKERIELQHLLVVEGAVVKHWRQEWVYKPKTTLQYQGRDLWKRTELTESAQNGIWVQKVYNVDDSPRYESAGRWLHLPGTSSWDADAVNRPLPRREYKVRDDYHVLLSANRHVITPRGWVHEQNNAKVVLDEQRKPVKVQALERGYNTYVRLPDATATEPAERYWQQNAQFWKPVREAWDDIYSGAGEIKLSEGAQHFPIAKALKKLNEETESRATKDQVLQALKPFVTVASAASLGVTQDKAQSNETPAASVQPTAMR